MTSTTEIAEFISQLNDNYDFYFEKTLSHKIIKHSEIVPLIEKYSEFVFCEITKLGKSVEKRSIYLLRFGKGKRKILCWSQMHGDESTATRALFDIFNFLTDDKLCASAKSKWFEELSLYFIPMLNPDGAEKYKRRNALDIDINRDAIKFQTPEGHILQSVIDDLRPEFAFNLHDQERYYMAGKSGLPATISFLAPAFDEKNTLNSFREQSVKLIVALNKILQTLIPGQTARYRDEFLATSFGNSIQSQGISAILIESGEAPNDIKRNITRKMNFVMLLSGFEVIRKNIQNSENTDDYYSIPQNRKDRFFDLLIRNVKITKSNYEFIADIGINQDEIVDKNTDDYSIQSRISNIGDLTDYAGFSEIDAEGGSIQKGKTSDKKAVTDEINIGDNADLVIKMQERSILEIINGSIYNTADKKQI